MASAVRNSMQMLGLDLPSAVAMATANPAAFLGLDHLVGRLVTGLRANLVIADRDIRVSQTWIDGACVFSA
jgi:N-acetylglucosamine-6-phosphate deacetylase